MRSFAFGAVVRCPGSDDEPPGRARRGRRPGGELESWNTGNRGARVARQVSRLPDSQRRLALTPGDRSCGVAPRLKILSKQPLVEKSMRVSLQVTVDVFPARTRG